MATSPWKELVKALDALAKAEKPKKRRKGRARKARKPKKIHPRRWHTAPAQRGPTASDAGDPWKSAHGASVGGEMPAITLAADAAHAIGGTLLDLAGEGKIGLSTALSAWQREQERVTNRAWRRPGGLARMAGL